MTRSREPVTLPPRLRAGKSAFRDLVDAFGGQEAAGVETGKSQSRICDYGHRKSPDFPPVDVVVKLEGALSRGGHHLNQPRAADAPVTRWMARQSGFALVPLPDPDAAEPGKWGLLASRLARDAGELTGGICADLSDDNDVSPQEARQRIAEASKLVRTAVELEQALRVRAHDGGADAFASSAFAWGPSKEAGGD